MSQSVSPAARGRPAPADGPPAATVRTVVLASLGGALEFYDFVAYGIFAAYIAPTFFPAQDELASLLSTFAVFAGGYLIRPLGGMAFSHFGDRFGRRSTFLASLLGISLATLGMALCPSYQAWGGWAPAAFVALRLLQGFCLGGELPGAITYVAEAAPPGRTGLACGLLFCCASLGVAERVNDFGMAGGWNLGLDSRVGCAALN
ncbi:MAG: MFS transporter [Planctomycetes bacterium]|nr:MFS transporter [Planctomycetota bacterium]